MKNLFVLVIAFMALVLTVSPVYAGKDKEDKKVDICHNTGSEHNPWEKLNINENAVQSHIDNHGDFVIDEEHPCPPEEENGNGDENGDGENGNGEEPRDVCSNIEGNQEAIPEGYELNNEENCVPVEEPTNGDQDNGKDNGNKDVPTITETQEVESLPDTGGGLEFIGLGLLAAIVGLGGRLLVKRWEGE
jgi:hypothetical protein